MGFKHTITTDLYCDYCGKYQACASNRLTASLRQCKKTAWAVARKLGCKRVKSGFLCSQCAPGPDQVINEVDPNKYYCLKGMSGPVYRGVDIIRRYPGWSGKDLVEISYPHEIE